MGFGIDMAKAREIHKTNIRNARTPKFAELDIEFQKALETGASTTDIVAKKQALRDAPADSDIASASDADALKAQWKTDILGDSRRFISFDEMGEEASISRYYGGIHFKKTLDISLFYGKEMGKYVINHLKFDK